MYRLYRRHFVVQLLNLLALLFLLGHHVLQILQLKFQKPFSEGQCPYPAKITIQIQEIHDQRVHG